MLRGKVTHVMCAGLAAFGLATSAFAQEGADMSPNQGALSFSAGADVVTTYVFRGIEQEDSGFIIQPYLEIGTNIFENEDYSLDLTLGNWNSLHSEETGATTGTSPEWWYEADLYAFLSLSAFEDWTFDVGYVGYFSPADAFADIHEVDLSVAYDDSKLWEEYAGIDFALNPYFLVAIEFDDRGGSDDTYGEFGVEPAFTLVESEDYPIDLSIPVTLGLSLDDYYTDSTGDNETFGYVSIGAMFSTELPFIPAEYGAWSASAGVTYYYLNEDAMLNDPMTATDGEDYNVVGSIGVSMDY